MSTPKTKKEGLPRFAKIKCFFGWHDLFVSEQYREHVGKIECRFCGKAWLHHEHPPVPGCSTPISVKWDKRTEDFVNSFYKRN